jgi:hypothetical protein
MNSEVIVESNTSEAPSDALEPGDVIASRHVVEAAWREHPLGELYHCRDSSTGDRVLLQRLRSEFAQPEVIDRLFETRGRAALGSACIPDILDYGVDFDGRPFVVCRASAEAQTLTELERPIAFVEAVELISDIARALIPAHADRLVHGGIEPASVLVERDGDGRPRVVAVLGFGLVPALEAGAERSRSLPLLMVPTHVAPELVRGAPMSPAADVYALGILLWELIHGAPPFRGPTLRVLDAHLSRALPALELPFDVPRNFDWILRRMLSKDPVDRFSDATEVVAHLRPFLAEPVTDLTFELEPEPDAPELRRGFEDDDEQTSIFDRPERAPARDQASPEPISGRVSGRVSGPVSGPVAVASALGRGSWAKWAALATLAVAGALILMQVVLDARGPAADASADPPEHAQAIASQVPVEAPQVTTPRPPLAVPAPPPAKLEPSKLGTTEFRARKAALYAKVEHGCLADRMRRTVKLGVHVGADGEVDSATVLGAMAGTGLARCVERQAAALEFPSSGQGGYYVYTLRLR